MLVKIFFLLPVFRANKATEKFDVFLPDTNDLEIWKFENEIQNP
jgi:hypothetical protein